MRILILSDIHANQPALEAVALGAAGRWDACVCLGDVVGYGASPNPAAAWVRAHAAATVRGNHDRACATDGGLERFRATAATAVRWTRAQLTPESRAWLRALPQGPLDWRGMVLAHGSPLDEDQYILGAAAAREVLASTTAALQWCGHTHIAGGFQLAGGRLEPLPTQFSRPLALRPKARYLLNPGSVGQPRDGDPRAACALYDEEAREVEFLRLAYDVADAQRRILEAGLPPTLASRLAAGE